MFVRVCGCIVMMENYPRDRVSNFLNVLFAIPFANCVAAGDSGDCSTKPSLDVNVEVTRISLY